MTGFRVIDAITGALAEAVPERIRAPGEGGTTSYSISGYDAEGTFNMYREAVMGNWGGGAHRDGLDGVANPAANIGNAPCEVVERQAPLRIERYELVPDSGGAGQWRGGLAVMRQFRYLGERATLQLRSDRRHHRPFGVHGGLPGAASTNLLLDDGREEQWPTKFVRPLLRNQALRHVTAGAGGYGDPLLRDPARVLDDVRNGKVSVQAAERDYGVQVSGSALVRGGAGHPRAAGRTGLVAGHRARGRGDERRGVRSHTGRRRHRRDLHRSRGTGRGASRAGQLLSRPKGPPRLRRRPPRHQALRMWTRPSDRAPSPSQAEGRLYGTVWTRHGQVRGTCPPLAHTRCSRVHILTASATTIHGKGNATGAGRFPHYSVIPGNPSTEYSDQFPR